MAARVEKQIELIQYADDSFIFNFWSIHRRKQGQVRTNANKFFQYFHEHQITVNTSKTELMIFGETKNKDFNEQIIIKPIPIDEKTEVKYLGDYI